MSTYSKKAVPLYLPGNCTWDPRKEEVSKDESKEWNKFFLVTEALEKLEKIEGPVCVVSIAGSSKHGKSYILSKAFDQGEVFPLGSSFDPATLSIWMWIVPKKYKVCHEIQ